MTIASKVGAAGYTIDRVGLSTLKFDPRNARRHPDRNMEAIKASLVKFGQVEPLVVRKKNKTVIGGNGRLQAMHELGWTQCEVHYVKTDEAGARALSIALNRTGELAEWDMDALAETMESFDEQQLLELGWDGKEVAELLGKEWAPPPVPEKLNENPDAIVLTPVQRAQFELAVANVRRLHGAKVTEEQALVEMARHYLECLP